MWDEVGIVRDAASLSRAAGALDELEARLDATGVTGPELTFNLTWHDWLNLKNLILVSKSIRFAGRSRARIRAGAHYRSDFPGRAGPRQLALYLRHLEGRALRHHHAAGGVHASEAGGDAVEGGGGCLVQGDERGQHAHRIRHISVTKWRKGRASRGGPGPSSIWLISP
jgi:hypothetical protein